AHATVAPRRIRRDLRLDELDAIHFPLTVMLPRVDHPPAAVSLLDIQHVFFPEFFSRAELAYRRVVYGWSLERARKVIAISRHVKATLVERMGTEPERIEVIHLGLDHALFHPNGAERRPFLLYPANPWPHKNHQRLFEAFLRVRESPPDVRLVLASTAHRRRALPAGVEGRGPGEPGGVVERYRGRAAVGLPPP